MRSAPTILNRQGGFDDSSATATATGSFGIVAAGFAPRTAPALDRGTLSLPRSIALRLRLVSAHHTEAFGRNPCPHRQNFPTGAAFACLRRDLVGHRHVFVRQAFHS